MAHDNQVARLTVQNESLRNQLKQLSQHMDSVIADHKKHKPSKSFETGSTEQYRTRMHEQLLRHEWQQLHARFTTLSENPTYQVNLQRQNNQLEAMIHQEQLSIKHLGARQRYNSLLMLRRANLVNTNADAGMVALKNIND